jgi:NADPH:quinone reductase-like Zn-dependent oxidoreductase
VGAVKALRFDRVGSLDALQLVETPRPAAVSGEVVVRVHAAGVNPSDVMNVLGKFPNTSLPRTPGREFAGVIVDGSAGDVGRHVWGSGGELGFTRDGSHAEYIAVPAKGLAPKPENLSFAEAAASGVPYLTALDAVESCGVEQGTAVAVIGMGAVGGAAVGIATARGARIMVGVRREEQASALRAQGVHAVTLSDPEGFVSQVRAYFDGGADVVFDTTGSWLPATIPALTAHGRVPVIAAPASGYERLPVRDLYRLGAHIIGVSSALRGTVSCVGLLEELRILFESGALRPPTGVMTRRLDDAIATYRDMASGVRGKFVLTPVE